MIKSVHFLQFMKPYGIFRLHVNIVEKIDMVSIYSNVALWRDPEDRMDHIGVYTTVITPLHRFI